MAKLNGVQTLDMVNGEITKVAYDGAEYAKVANDFNNAQTGDIFLHTGNGAYYELMIRDSYFCGINHPVRFITNGGRESGFMRGCNIHPLFRKVSESSPTLEQRVSALESEVSALKGGNDESEKTYEYQKGDIIRITKEFYEHKAGDIKVIDRINLADKELTYGFENAGGWANPSVMELVAKSPETITFEGAEYCKVDREARAGDVFIITHNDGGLPEWFTVGKSYKVLPPNNREPGLMRVIADDGDDLCVYHNDCGRNRETVDVYELVAKEPAPKFAVGDYVKVVKSELGNEGKIVQITDDSDGLQMRKANGDVVDADYVGIPVGDTEVYGFTKDQLVAATDEEIAEASKPKLKAGDFIKFKDDAIDIVAGKAYELFEDSHGIYFEDEDGCKRWHHFDCEYEIVDAETSKWAKLGRKVNEAKVGDIVRVIIDVSAKPVGTIFVVRRVLGLSSVRDENGKYYTLGANVELIAPVEAVLA